MELLFKPVADALLNILVSRLRFIGDIVLSTPVLEVLKERFPDASIDYLGDSEGTTLLRHNPNLNEIIPYDFSAWEVREQIRIGALLRKKRYDVAIDLFGNPRSAIVIYLSGAEMRIGGRFGWRRRLFTHPVAVSDRLDAVSFHLRYLEPLGIKGLYRKPKIYLDDDEINSSVKSLDKIGVNLARPIVGMHIGATWPAKVWPAERFARLAELITREGDAQVFVTFGPKDFDCLKAFSSEVRTKFYSMSPQPLRSLAAAISRCELFVSNDAAPMHIAAAVGTPTIGIFGPGEPDIWFPYDRSRGNFAIHKEVACCHGDYCEMKGSQYMQCMKSISPEEIYDRIKILLREGLETGIDEAGKNA